MSIKFVVLPFYLKKINLFCFPYLSRVMPNFLNWNRLQCFDFPNLVKSNLITNWIDLMRCEEYLLKYHKPIFSNNFSDVLPTNDSFFYFSWLFDTKNFYSQKDFFQHIFYLKEQNVIINNPLWLEKIKNTESVAIHVRLTDFLEHPHLNVCDKSYYQKALSLIKEKIQHSVFYLFSDDLSSPIMRDLGILELNPIIIKNDDYLADFYLISQCKHAIIPSSSFSFLSSLLTDSPQKIVFYPISSGTKVWKYPNHWIGLNTDSHHSKGSE